MGNSIWIGFHLALRVLSANAQGVCSVNEMKLSLTNSSGQVSYRSAERTDSCTWNFEANYEKYNALIINVTSISMSCEKDNVVEFSGNLFLPYPTGQGSKYEMILARNCLDHGCTAYVRRPFGHLLSEYLKGKGSCNHIIVGALPQNFSAKGVADHDCKDQNISFILEYKFLPLNDNPSSTTQEATSVNTATKRGNVPATKEASSTKSKSDATTTRVSSTKSCDINSSTPEKQNSVIYLMTAVIALAALLLASWVALAWKLWAEKSSRKVLKEGGRFKSSDSESRKVVVNAIYGENITNRGESGEREIVVNTLYEPSASVPSNSNTVELSRYETVA